VHFGPSRNQLVLIDQGLDQIRTLNVSGCVVFFGWPQHFLEGRSVFWMATTFYGRHPGGTIPLVEADLTARIQKMSVDRGADYRLDRLLS
jgi:hypothetical protein